MSEVLDYLRQLHPYFWGNNIYFAAYLASLVILFLLRKKWKNSYHAFFWYAVIALIVVIYNPLSMRAILPVLGTEEGFMSVYVRIFLILPMFATIACALTELITLSKRWITYLALVMLTVSAAFWGVSPKDSNYYMATDNPYKVNAEAVQLGDMIRTDADSRYADAEEKIAGHTATYAYIPAKLDETYGTDLITQGLRMYSSEMAVDRSFPTTITDDEIVSGQFMEDVRNDAKRSTRPVYFIVLSDQRVVSEMNQNGYDVIGTTEKFTVLTNQINHVDEISEEDRDQIASVIISDAKNGEKKSKPIILMENYLKQSFADVRNIRRVGLSIPKDNSLVKLDETEDEKSLRLINQNVRNSAISGDADYIVLDDRISNVSDEYLQEYDMSLLASVGEHYRIFKNGKKYTNLWTVTDYPQANGAQGMCYSITDLDGHLILVDGGFDLNSELLLNMIIDHGSKVDAWIITHPHQDHVSAFNNLMNSGFGITVDTIYTIDLDYDYYRSVVNQYDGGFEYYEAFLKAIDGQNVEYVKTGDKIDLFGLQMDVLNAYDLEDSDYEVDPANNGSMMFKLSGQDKSMLFCADVTGSLYNKITDKYGDELKADYLQVSHHGIGGTMPADFDLLVDPEVAFMDLPGWVNIGDEVSGSIREKLIENGTTVYNFDDDPRSVEIR